MAVSLQMNKLNSLIKRVDEFNGLWIEAGFFEDSKYGPDNHNLPVAQVAWWNENGTSLNPQRPFMSDTFQDRNNILHIQNSFRRIATGLIGNTGYMQLVRNLGEMVKDMIQVSIDDYPGSNSPSTIERKGFNDPLLDTGKMLESVKYKVGGRG